MDLIKVAEEAFATGKKFPEFRAGDTITVAYKIIEGSLRREELSLQSKEIAFLGIGCPCFIQSISFKGIKQEKNLFFLLLFYFIQVFSLCSRESFTLRPVTVGSQVTNLQGT